MSLFLDEKTKEEKFDKAREQQNGSMWFSQKSLDDSIDWRNHIAKYFYLAGWNECEKHVRESASEGFESWNPFEDDSWGKEISEQAWQACAIAKDKESMRAKSKLPDNLVPCTSCKCTVTTYWQIKEELCRACKIQSLESQLQHSKEWFSEAEERIKLLESQLKERDEALIDFEKALASTWPGEYGGVVRLHNEMWLSKHQSLINQINESRK